MNTLDWKTGLLRLYYALWCALICWGFVVLGIDIQNYGFNGIDIMGIAAWIGLVVIAPAVLLKLITWIGSGFMSKD